LAKGSVVAVDIRFEGEFDRSQTIHLTRAVLKGLLTPALTDSVNYVNAPGLAAGRGIRVTESNAPRGDDPIDLLTIVSTDANGPHVISGTVVGKGEPHVVVLDGYAMDFRPEGFHIMVRNHDQPGMVGKIGTLLGEASVNIAGMYLGREFRDGTAVMALSIDGPATEETMQAIRAVPGIRSARLVEL